MRRPSLLTAALIAFVLVIMAVQPASAFKPKSHGGYLTLELNSTSIEGDDFDGLTYYESSDFIAVVPTVPSGNGFRLAFGFQSAGQPFAFEFAYARSSHDGKFGGYDAKSTLNGISMEGQWHFHNKGVFQPFIDAGLAFSWLSAKDAYLDVSMTVKDVSYRGLTPYLGAGARFFVAPSVALVGGIDREFHSFVTLKADGGESTKIEKMKGSSWTFSLGVMLWVGNM